MSMWDNTARPEVPRAVRGNIPIHHRYTVGVAGERFFKEMRDHKRLLASQCPSCGEAFIPPKIYCERCFEETTEWVPVQGPGYVKSFTMLHESLDGQRLAAPQVVAFVGWEGFQGGLVHRIEDINSEEVKIGIAVEPVWAHKRMGGIDDIAHFRPAGERA